MTLADPSLSQIWVSGLDLHFRVQVLGSEFRLCLGFGMHANAACMPQDDKSNLDICPPVSSYACCFSLQTMGKGRAFGIVNMGIVLNDCQYGVLYLGSYYNTGPYISFPHFENSNLGKLPHSRNTSPDSSLKPPGETCSEVAPKQRPHKRLGCCSGTQMVVYQN